MNISKDTLLCECCLEDGSSEGTELVTLPHVPCQAREGGAGRQHLTLEIVFRSVPKLLPDCTPPAQRHFFQCGLMARLKLSSV